MGKKAKATCRVCGCTDTKGREIGGGVTVYCQSGEDICINCEFKEQEVAREAVEITSMESHDDLLPEFIRIPIGSIIVSESIREQYDPDAMTELVESVKIHGILEPLLVNQCVVDVNADHEQYHLISGSRRLKAAFEVGLEMVPCMVYYGLDWTSVSEKMIIENLIRSDLNAVEEAKACRDLIDRTGMSVSELAGRLGKSQPYLSNRLRLLQGPEELRNMIISREITPSHALLLLPFTPYKAWPDMLAFFQRRNGDMIYRNEHPIPRSQMDSLFDDFLIWSGGRTKTKYFMQRPSYGGCKECDKLITIGQIPYCFDVSCYKAKAKAVKETKKAVEKAEKADLFVFPGKTTWQYDRCPVDPKVSPCAECDKRGLEGNVYTCADKSCYDKLGADNLAKIRYESKQMEDRLFTDAATLVKALDLDKSFNILIDDCMRNVYSGDYYDDVCIRLFGSKLKAEDLTREQKVRVISFYRFAYSFRSGSYGQREVKQFNDFAKRYGMDVTLVLSKKEKNLKKAEKKAKAEAEASADAVSDLADIEEDE
ncbi:MAG: ParB/RepB/Spo0J family partition protein [Methanomassiliicoccaceae archaeon]|nr:ParB/RepB/Spo0J family partition protein [Methanomassiliicoccaceae archaeon]